MVDTKSAANMALIVRAFIRLGVSQPKWWFCSQLLKPVAADAAVIAQPTHTRPAYD